MTSSGLGFQLSFIISSYFFFQVMEIQRFPACTSTTLMGWMMTTSTTGTWLYLRFEIQTIALIKCDFTSLARFKQESCGPIRAAPVTCWLLKKKKKKKILPSLRHDYLHGKDIIATTALAARDKAALQSASKLLTLLSSYYKIKVG